MPSNALRCTSVILLAITVSIQSIQASDFLYDTVSTTVDGDQCLANCVNNTCIVDFEFKMSSCNPGHVRAPLYYTSQVRTKRKYCLSACGRFGWESEWCVVSARNKEWDYCSTAVRDENSIVRGAQFTVENHLCKDECKLDENNRYTCTSYWKEKYLCSPRKLKDYIRAKTSTYGVECAGLCSKAENETYLWCYIDDNSTPNDKKWDYCAPPASRRMYLYNSLIYTYEFEGGDVYV